MASKSERSEYESYARVYAETPNTYVHITSTGSPTRLPRLHNEQEIE